MLLLKLLLIACTVYLSSLAAKRGGHGLAGLVTGMPMIIGPILGLVLMDHGPGVTQKIAWATITCFPATPLHALVFSHAARRCSWPVCLMLATLVFLFAASFLSWLALPPGWAAGLALVSPSLALACMPQTSLHTSGPPGQDSKGLGTAIAVQIPASEVFYRIAAAVAMAAAILLGADYFPVFVSGLLLAIPIAGAVLPSFTLPRYGHVATVNLLKGFARGLNGFCVFCIVLALLLNVVDPVASFVLALCAAAAAAWLFKRRAQTRQ